MGGFESLLVALSGLWDRLVSEPVAFAARVALVALLGASSLYKARHPLIAAAAAVNFRVVRRPWKRVGYALAAVEMVTAGLLAAPWPTAALAGCGLAGCLSIGFAFVIGRALRAHDHFPCHCLSGADDDVSGVTLARAVAMVAAAVIGAVGLVGRGLAIPAMTIAVPGIGLAAAMLGIPLAVYCAAVVWRRYRALLAAVDWEWVIAQRAGRVVPRRQD